MIDKIPPVLDLPTRRFLVEQHKKFHRSHNPEIDISDKGEPDIAARVAADSALPLLAHARKVGDCAVVASSFGDGVRYWGEVHGVPPSPATGSIGFVKIKAGVGGGTIQRGDPLFLKNQGSGPRFECSVTRKYFTGDSVPVHSTDVGFETNLPPGQVLVWATNIPGIHPEAVVVEQDGEGLVGGRPAATPEEHKQAILDKLSDPPGASNAAHYRFEAKRAGVAIQQAYSYSAIRGPGVIAMAFTVPASRRAGSRIPLESQVRLVGEHLEGAFGADDGLLMALIIGEPKVVAYRVKWKREAKGWEDSSPWPEYAPAGAGAVVVSSVTDALNFILATDDAEYSGVEDPQAGDTFALFNLDTGRFVKKRIRSVTGTGPWTIVVETNLSVSDDQYTPVVGQRVSPWADDLDTIATNVIETFNDLGPGEMTTPLPVDGIRRQRVPAAPEQWPHTLTQSLLEDKINAARIPTLFDREVVEGDGAAPTQGTPGVLVYMIELGDLAVFEKV